MKTTHDNTRNSFKYRMFMHGKLEFVQAGETSEGLLKNEKGEKNNLGRLTIQVLFT